jgi:DNA invertase Pin-like site-specific DNA recombinase
LRRAGRVKESHRPYTFRSELHALGIDLFLHQQGVDTTTPAGKALFQIMGVFAEFERAIIRERVKLGLARAKAQGRTHGRPTIDPEKEAAIRADLLAAKAGIIKLATAHGVGVGTVHGSRLRWQVERKPPRCPRDVREGPWGDVGRMGKLGPIGCSVCWTMVR